MLWGGACLKRFGENCTLNKDKGNNCIVRIVECMKGMNASTIVLYRYLLLLFI